MGMAHKSGPRQLTSWSIIFKNEQLLMGSFELTFFQLQIEIGTKQDRNNFQSFEARASEYI